MLESLFYDIDAAKYASLCKLSFSRQGILKLDIGPDDTQLKLIARMPETRAKVAEAPARAPVNVTASSV